MVKSSVGILFSLLISNWNRNRQAHFGGHFFLSFSELLFSTHWVLLTRQGKKIPCFLWFLESRIYLAILTDQFSSKNQKGIRKLYFYISIYHVLLCLFKILIQVYQSRMWNHTEITSLKLISVPTLYLKNKLRR